MSDRGATGNEVGSTASSGARDCPKCGHSDEEHRRESWYDEEGIEGMTCATCDDAGRLCQWWTWDWADVLARAVTHQGDDDEN